MECREQAIRVADGNYQVPCRVHILVHAQLGPTGDSDVPSRGHHKKESYRVRGKQFEWDSPLPFQTGENNELKK